MKETLALKYTRENLGRDQRVTMVVASSQEKTKRMMGKMVEMVEVRTMVMVVWRLCLKEMETVHWVAGEDQETLVHLEMEAKEMMILPNSVCLEKVWALGEGPRTLEAKGR